MNEFSPMVEVKKMRGCYLLWNKGVVVYAGQSENILARIGMHLAAGEKDFDAFNFVELEGDLNEYEAELIVRYKPRYNSTLPINPKYAKCTTMQKNAGRRSVRRLVKKLKLLPVWKDYYLVTDVMGGVL